MGGGCPYIRFMSIFCMGRLGGRSALCKAYVWNTSHLKFASPNRNTSIDNQVRMVVGMNLLIGLGFRVIERHGDLTRRRTNSKRARTGNKDNIEGAKACHNLLHPQALKSHTPSNPQTPKPIQLLNPLALKLQALNP